MSINSFIESKWLKPAMMGCDAALLTACGACMAPAYGIDPVNGAAIGATIVASKWFSGTAAQLLSKDKAHIYNCHDYCPLIACAPLATTCVVVGAKAGCSSQLATLTGATCCVGTTAIWGLGTVLCLFHCSQLRGDPFWYPQSNGKHTSEGTDDMNIRSTLYESATGQITTGKKIYVEDGLGEGRVIAAHVSAPAPGIGKQKRY